MMLNDRKIDALGLIKDEYFFDVFKIDLDVSKGKMEFYVHYQMPKDPFLNHFFRSLGWETCNFLQNRLDVQENLLRVKKYIDIKKYFNEGGEE